MTTTYTGDTPATTTDYRPHPERTDSEFNLLQQGYANQRDRLERLRRLVAALTSENASLKAHIEADHAFLSNTDDGPEVAYDWSQAEDSVEYNLPGA